MSSLALTRKQRAALKSSLRRAKERGLQGTISLEEGMVVWQSCQTGQLIARQPISNILHLLHCD